MRSLALLRVIVVLALAGCPSAGDGTGSTSTSESTGMSGASTSTSATLTSMSDEASTQADTSSSEASSGGTTTSSGSTGDTEPGGCAQVMITGDLFAPDLDGDQVGVFRTTGELLGDAAFRDRISIDFFDGATGPFDLASMGVNDNYSTCHQCIRLIEDLDFDAGMVANVYFQSQGTIDIDASSDVFGTSLSATLTGVRLVEVMIDPMTFVSTPVPGGECADIVDGTITGTAIPTDWMCVPTAYAGLDGCDCGCSLPDLDCLDATIDSCNFCDTSGSCSMEMCPGTISAADNSMCG
jgi:hypothetical protein